MDWWELTQRFGLPMAMALVAIGAFYSGHVVSKVQHDREMEAERTFRKEALEARDRLYEAMQAAWRRQYDEVAAERDFLRETGTQNTESLSQSTALLIELVRGRKDA